MAGLHSSDSLGELEETIDLSADERLDLARQSAAAADTAEPANAAESTDTAEPAGASVPADSVTPLGEDNEATAVDAGKSVDSDIRTRELVWADVTQVAVLESELFGASAWTMGMLTEELRGVGRWYIGAHPVDDGGHSPLVGYAGLWFDGEDAHIMTVGVSPEHRGQGIGQALMTQLVTHARQVGAHSMLLEVAVNNPAAIAMYDRAGFERLGLRKRYYQPEDVDAYTMRLILKERVPPIGGLP